MTQCKRTLYGLSTCGLVFIASFIGCGSDSDTSSPAAMPSPTVDVPAVMEMMPASRPIDPDAKAQYACRYQNPFSGIDECRNYYGDWSRTAVDGACDTAFTNVMGTVSEVLCKDALAIGTCTSAPDEDGLYFRIWFYGGEIEVTSQLCGQFLNGTWSDLDASTASGPAIALPTAEAVSFLSSTADVKVEPDCIDGSCLEVLIEEKRGLRFIPLTAQATTGFILYPGAQVDPRAYAPIAHGMAQAGVLTVIVPMPGSFALNGWERATDIQTRFPEISSWFLGGHSMGGAMSVHYAKENPDILDGVVLWAAYAGAEDDISTTQERVLSIYGDLDGVATVDEIDDGKALLPDTTTYQVIRGGNHAQFGQYGEQDGDSPADIPASVQNQQVMAATLHFIRTSSLSEPADRDPIYAAAPTMDWCNTAQRIIAGVDDDVANDVFSTEFASNVEAFTQMAPRFDESQSRGMIIPTYILEHGNWTLLSAPPILPREVWCKLSEQAAVVEQVGVGITGEPGVCADVNQAAFNWALDQLSPGERSKFDELELRLVFGADVPWSTALEWTTDGEVAIVEETTDEGGQISVTSAAAIVRPSNDDGENGTTEMQSSASVHCKLIAPTEAFRLIKTYLVD